MTDDTAAPDEPQATLSPERMFVREAARKRQPLDGPDAQALEYAITQLEIENAAQRARIEELDNANNEYAFQIGTIKGTLKSYQRRGAKDFTDNDTLREAVELLKHESRPVRRPSGQEQIIFDQQRFRGGGSAR